MIVLAGHTRLAAAQQLGLDALAWARPGRDPVVAGRGCGLRSFVQSVEWPLLAAVDPGHWTNLRPDAHPRSGRMRGLACHGFMARPARGAEGVLVGLSTGPAHGPRARWVRLAEWVAVSFQAEEEQFMARVQERERKLGRQTAALTHDLRNQLNLASMQLERLRAEVQVPIRGGGADGEDHAQGLADLSRSWEALGTCARAPWSGRALLNADVWPCATVFSPRREGPGTWRPVANECASWCVAPRIWW